MLKWVPYALMVIGALLLIAGVAVGARAGDAPQAAFAMGVAGVVFIAFGVTVYMFTEGVSGRRAGY